jgi:AcrR family transcriptional regulator
MPDGRAQRDRFQPTTPRRRGAVARAEGILDGLDRLLAQSSPSDIGLPAIAREAAIPLSSIYHLFPTAEAAFTGLVRRYNARMDKELEALLAGPLPGTWQEIARELLSAVRDFYARNPVLARVVLGAVPERAARVTDDAHIAELAERFALEIERRFEAPHVRDLPRRLAIAMAISDRVWSLGVTDDGTIPDFLFEESLRALAGYLGHYLPPCLEQRRPAAA